jgi:formate/nitrite transporter FocA (FNT family)
MGRARANQTRVHVMMRSWIALRIGNLIGGTPFQRTCVVPNRRRRCGTVVAHVSDLRGSRILCSWCLLFATLLIAGAIMCGARVIRTLCAQRSLGRLLLLTVLTACAVAVGIRYGVYHVFQLCDHVRMQGMPVPLVFFLCQ